jgi:hypothetical protein
MQNGKDFIQEVMMQVMMTTLGQLLNVHPDLQTHNCLPYQPVTLRRPVTCFNITICILHLIIIIAVSVIIPNDIIIIIISAVAIAVIVSVSVKTKKIKK